MRQRMTDFFKRARSILLEAGRQFGRDRCNRMAAAISYRLVFALAPILIIAVSVVGIFLGSSDQAQEELLDVVIDVAGAQAASFVSDFLDSALRVGDTAALIGIALLFWTASSLFLEIQHDLNDIFAVPYRDERGLMRTVIKRSIGFLWTIGLGLLVIAVWLLNSVWRFIEELLPEGLSQLHGLIELATPLVSLLVLPLLFGLVFQTMTSIRVRWKPVWWGGLFTALMFVLASQAIGWYFSAFGEPNALGFASSVVVLLVFAYFLASVFLFGAEVTHVYTLQLEDGVGGGRRPTGQPDVLVAQPPPPVPLAAIGAFLSGLVIGWRRSKK